MKRSLLARLRLQVRRAQRYLSDDRGTIAVMSGVIALASLGALAVGVDSASLYVERRRAQSAVDLAAIAAARDLPRAEAAARAAINDNGIADVRGMFLTTGHYTPDPDLPPENRFVPDVSPVNAVRVELHSRAPLYFARAFLRDDDFLVVTRATAVSSAAAAFSVGSRLLSLNGGIMNAVLGKLLGGNISLTAMDYNSLAGFHVDLFRFSDALSARVSGNFATYDELIEMDTSLANIVDALADVARQDASNGAFSALRLVGNATDRGLEVPLAQLIHFGSHGSAAIGEGGSAFSVRASALYLLTTAAQIANGNRQVEVVSQLQLPGVAAMTVGILIGERPQNSPWIGVGEREVRVYTAQTRVRLLAEAGGSGLLAGARIRLPVYLDVAAAEARLLNVTCGPDPSRDAHVRIGVVPSVASLWLAEPANSSDWTGFRDKPSMISAQFVAAPAIAASGKAHAEIANLREEAISFDWGDIAALRAKTVRTRDYTASLVASLANDLRLDIQAGPLTVGTPAALGRAVVAALTPATRAVDSMLGNLVEILGLGLGEADVRVHGVRCDGAVLVN